MNDFTPACDASALALLRKVLDEILTSRSFLELRSVSSLEIAEHC